MRGGGVGGERRGMRAKALGFWSNPTWEHIFKLSITK
jgi:hypothetical protein